MLTNALLSTFAATQEEGRPAHGLALALPHHFPGQRSPGQSRCGQLALGAGEGVKEETVKAEWGQEWGKAGLWADWPGEGVGVAGRCATKGTLSGAAPAPSQHGQNCIPVVSRGCSEVQRG